ncbi:pseudaminic acid synthase [Vibrio maritimus]
MANKTFHIGSRRIGESEPCFVIAELSGNHGGSLERALQMLEAAAKAGADAVKIQVYTPDTITLKSDKPDFVIAEDNAWAQHKTLYELYQHAHTPWEWLDDIFQYAAQLGIEVFGSVFDTTSIDELEKYPVKVYKIAAPEIVDVEILERVAKTGKPVILSTGLANLTDISRAIATLERYGCHDIGLLKCTTAYPTPANEVNLRTMQNMAQTFSVPVGLSDHTTGIGVPIAAATLNASMLEKHIKLDDDTDSVDSFFSLTVSEFSMLVDEVKKAQLALGIVTYDLSPSAAKNANGRRSLYISRDIKAGEVITEQHIRSVRPCFGLPVSDKPKVIGRRAKVDLELGDRLSWEVLE